MNPEALFTFASAVVLPGWILLAVAPRWKVTHSWVCGVVLPLLLCGLYAYLLLTNFGSAEGGGFGSLEGVSRLFSVPGALLAGWVHYLIFDLFVGAWEVRDAQRLGISHFAVLPCLALTFLAGPIGLLFYLLLRWALRRRVSLDELGEARAATT